MESKYFTPEIEDLHIGYECEFKNDKQDNTWKKEIFDWDLMGIYFATYEDNVLGELEDSFRVPYLTGEQIEAEGWVFGGYQCNEDKIYEKNLYMLNYNEKTKQAILLIRDPASVPDYYLEPSFRGECKDINTFRTICKLLGI